MVAGRLVWGAVRFVLAGLVRLEASPFSAFLSGALFTAVPGIIAQLVLIPSSSPLCRKPRCWSNRFSLPLSQVKKLVQHPNNIFSICNSTLLLLH